ncbi:ribose 5-phosphate isomerase A [Methyloceanibacter stevinii]|uniref:ribose 5-phosphate isomerase A n=1 Tax=Methyloceanibacter stevinii TaxID=1774970 RepID=UPI0009F1B11E|nr:ribose 5-phosphate isomerase A [Methyloceanibacter stevinii]
MSESARTIEGYKAAAARAAIELVQPGMRLGLGTGSTAAPFVEEVGARVRDGLNVICVPTSEATRAHAEALGIPLTTWTKPRTSIPTVPTRSTISIRLIKGGGGAFVAGEDRRDASERMVVIADTGSFATLGSHPLPIEVVRFGLKATVQLIQALSAEAGCEGEIRLRPGEGGRPFVTDQGNLIVDCAFPKIAEPEVLAFALTRVPGVVEHGLFLGLCDMAIVAGANGVQVLKHPSA